MAPKLFDHFRYYVATVFGIGFIPVASGTFGSMFALLIVALWFPSTLPGQIILIFLVSLIGLQSSQWIAWKSDREDPSEVVIDEVAGQFLVFLAIPQPLTWPVLLLGFFLFRALDVWKPWLVGRAEKLPGGWGIMADDLVAGIFVNLILQICLRVFG